MRDAPDCVDLTSKVQVGLIEYNHEAKVAFYMNELTTREDVKLAVSQLQFTGGRTNTQGEFDVIFEQAQQQSLLPTSLKSCSNKPLFLNLLKYARQFCACTN